ncbi:MAG: cytochrome P450 [Sphingomonadales bacterium]
MDSITSFLTNIVENGDGKPGDDGGASATSHVPRAQSLSAHDFPLMPLGQACDMGHAPDGTPLIDPRIFNSAEFFRNPYPYYRIMRDHYPVFFDKLHNCYYVTRYDDITTCYFDDEGFNTIPKGSSSGVLGNTQLELSGVEHRRRRNLYGQHLVGKSLDNRLHAIESIGEEMIADWDNLDESIVQDRNGVRSVAIGRAFANEFPIRVVCDVLGFPKESRSKFFFWYNSMMSGLGGSETHHQGLVARQDLEDYVGTLVEERREKPTYLYDAAGNPTSKDIISKLCETQIDGDYLSTEEITSNIALVVGGGGETTRGAILNMWYLLLQHPDQLKAVLDDPDAMWDVAFHETLRHSTPIGGQPRHNSFDIELHGVKIPAGSLVNMVDFSANHDERIFKDPEVFNIFRPDLYSGKLLRSGFRKDGRCSHMAFGVGPHLCPGAWISHQEAVIGSKILQRHLKNPCLNVEKMPKDIDGSLMPIGLVSAKEVWIDYDL